MKPHNITLQQRAFFIQNKWDNIKAHLLLSYNKILKGENTICVIRAHRKFINGMDVQGKNKNKCKTIVILEHYKNTEKKNKALATMILANTLNNMAIFRSL